MSDGMIENFTAEGVGLAASVILVTLFGGWITWRWTESNFGKKWKKHRLLIAQNIVDEFDVLDNQLFYFGKDLIGTSQKAMNELSALDHSTMQNKQDEIRVGFERLNGSSRATIFVLGTKTRRQQLPT